MVESRHTVKQLIYFARREYKEKHPKSVTVYRIKRETSLTRGVLPILHIRSIGNTRFLVIANYVDNIRMYAFNQQGILLSGENYETSMLNKIKKHVKKVYKVPK